MASVGCTLARTKDDDRHASSTLPGAERTYRVGSRALPPIKGCALHPGCGRCRAVRALLGGEARAVARAVRAFLRLLQWIWPLLRPMTLGVVVAMFPENITRFRPEALSEHKTLDDVGDEAITWWHITLQGSLWHGVGSVLGNLMSIVSAFPSWSLRPPVAAHAAMPSMPLSTGMWFAAPWRCRREQQHRVQKRSYSCSCGIPAIHAAHRAQLPGGLGACARYGGCVLSPSSVREQVGRLGL